jgi:hypothetical protein
MHLRDSLIYRSESLTWHVMQLARMQAAAMAKLHSTMPIQNAAGDIMRLMHRHQQFTFDDVIFNAISLFDYVGNTVGFAYYGEPRHRSEWKKVRRFARDAAFERKEHPTPRISGRTIGETIVEADRSFVARLSEYRATLIHYEAKRAGGKVSTSFKGGAISMN